MPDARMQYFAVQEIGRSRLLSQADRHAAISALTLDDRVPVEIRAQFDTARNAYLYAWYVYRFHAMAEHHALATLELALKSALRSSQASDEASGNPAESSRVNPTDRSDGKGPEKGLTRLLRRAAERGLIDNDRLPLRRQWALELARQRTAVQRITLAAEQGVDEVLVSDDPPAPTQAELDFDWIAHYCEYLPKLRNTYAHGSESVHATVLRTFEVVWSLVNQLFVRARPP